MGPLTKTPVFLEQLLAGNNKLLYKQIVVSDSGVNGVIKVIRPVSDFE